jgi:hypothetical protein
MTEEVDLYTGSMPEMVSADYGISELAFTGAGNLFPDAGWVRYKKDGTRWTVGEAWLIEAVTASMTAKRGRWRAKLANTAIALDAFGRSVTDGWGSADTGGAYTLTGAAADFDVDGSIGTMSVPANASRTASLLSTLVRDVDVTARFALSAVPVGDTVNGILRGRRIDASNRYGAVALVDTAGAVTVAVDRLVGGVNTILGSFAATGVTLVAGTYLRVRFQVSGAYPTTLRVRAWLDGDSEPTTWASEQTDSSAALQTAGSIGILSGANAALTNGPIVFSWDDLAAYELPFTVVRDLFGRTSVDSWGSADQGGAYGLTGTAADFDVNSGVGKILVNASDGKAASLASVSARDVQGLHRWKTDKVPTGASLEIFNALRRLDNSNLYRSRLLIAAGGAMSIEIQRVLVGVVTALGSPVSLGTYAVGPFYWVRFEADGVSPTNLRVKVWADGDPEPASWNVETTDSSAALQVAGSTYLGAASGAISNAPILVSFDDFSVIRSATALALDSDYIACGVQQLYSLAELTELDYQVGAFRTQLREYDASKVFIQGQDLIVYDNDAEWPSVEVGRYAGTAAAPPVNVGIDVEPHANTRHVKVRRAPDADSVGSWIIAAQAVIDGPAAQLTSSPDASAEAVVSIDGGGIIIDGGGLRVENAGSVVIIDGTSEHFLIAASGTVSRTQGANSVGTGAVSLSGYSDLPVVLSTVGNSSTGGYRAVGSYFDAETEITTYEDASFVAATSGGAVTRRVGTHYIFAALFFTFSAPNLLIELAVSNRSASSITRYARYYVLTQSAL